MSQQASNTTTSGENAPHPDFTPARGWLGKLDQFMLRHPWHPRLTPFFVYLALLGVTGLLRSEVHVATYPPAYIIQCAIPIYLFWRYRKLMPELTLRFDWLAVPVAIFVTAVWVGMGRGMAHAFPQRFGDPGYNYLLEMGLALGWTSMALRLLGMSIVPPLIEEMFYRSLLLRSCYRAKPVGHALAQIISDLPVIGDLLANTRMVREADKHPRPLGDQFERTPYGKLSVFNVALVTLVWVFVGGHAMRDWPATVICSIAWCLLAAARREKGLGPVIWSHGLTNAFLWVYSVAANDYRWF